MSYKLISERSDYLTPPELIEKILKIEGVKKFDVDTCCTQHNVPAKKHYTEKENGYIQPWGKLNWCNPPFKFARYWLEKAFSEQQKGNSTWLIIPFRPECKYWSKILNQKAVYHNRILENENFYMEIWEKGFGFLIPETKEFAGIYKNPLALLKLKGLQNEK